VSYKEKLLFTAINTALLLTQGIFTVMQTSHALIISAVITAIVIIINGKQVYTTVTDILKKRKPKPEAIPAAEVEETEKTEETNEQNSGDNV
jgi:hypothetical protein